MRESRIKKLLPEKRVLSVFYAGLCTLYVSGLVYIVFFARRRWVPFSKRSIHIIPFQDKTQYLQTYSTHTRPENIEFYKDFIGNILLFVPFPFLLCYVLAIKSFRKLLMLSMGTSLVVETVQYIFNIGVADIDDLLLNTFGASIGLLLLYIASSKNLNPFPSLKGMSSDKLNYHASSK
jgi:glycopeptide antibiotics resistance protein